MRRCAGVLIVIVGWLLGTPSGSLGATKDISDELTELRAPSAPAFSLLGVQPASVEHPSNGHALVVSLITATTESQGLIPQNYALEVTPYWLADRTLRYEDLYGGPLANILHSLALSFGTSSIEKTDTTDAATRAAIGMRALILAVDLRRHEREQLEQDLLRLDGERLDPPRGKTREEIDKQIDQKTTAIQESYRKRLLLEYASGLSGEVPDQAAERGKISSTAAWMTLSYGVTGKVDLLGVARYRRDQIQRGGMESWELGTRVCWIGSRAAFSVEGLKRAPTDGTSKNSARWAGIFEYRILKDAYLNATFGRDFEGTDGNHPLVSLVGMKWGWGKPLISGKG